MTIRRYQKLEDGTYGVVVRDATPEEEAEFHKPIEGYRPEPFEIEELKRRLADTDYIAIKFAEGWLTAEEYADVRAERQAMRDRINELEKSL